MGLLDGITILDLTQRLPGPFCSMMLGDMGARVIQVESLEGDQVRKLQPLVGGMGTAYHSLGRNKESVILNLKHSKGCEAFLRLAETSDVIVEGNRPGVAKRLGVDYAAVRARRPDIIYCSITGYGQDGPYRDRPGHDLNCLGYSGILSMTGARGGPPTIPGVQIADVGAGALMALSAILGALVHRGRTGEGQNIDVAMLDGLMSWLTLQAVGALVTGVELGEGLFNGGNPCYAIYPAADGHITLAAIERHFWVNLCRDLGREDLLHDQFASGVRSRMVQAELAAIFQKQSRAYWCERFDRAGICGGPVNSVNEAFADPHVRHRQMLLQQGTALVPQLGFPFKLSSTPMGIMRPAPRHGEHTKAVLAELGYDQEMLTAMEHVLAIAGERPE